jgi:hypothetical protein
LALGVHSIARAGFERVAFAMKGNFYGCEKILPVGGACDDGLDPPTAGTIHGKRSDDRASAGFEEGFAQGSGIRNAHAHLLHQPRRARSERLAAERARASKSSVIKTSSQRQDEARAQRPQNLARRPAALARGDSPAFEPGRAFLSLTEALPERIHHVNDLPALWYGLFRERLALLFRLD